MVSESSEFKSIFNENNTVIIEKTVSLTEKEVFSFYFMESKMTLFLNTYALMTRASPRHKFRTSKKYSRLSHQSNLEVQLCEVPLTDKIKELALDKFKSEIKVNIWTE